MNDISLQGNNTISSCEKQLAEVMKEIEILQIQMEQMEQTKIQPSTDDLERYNHLLTSKNNLTKMIHIMIAKNAYERDAERPMMKVVAYDDKILKSPGNANLPKF